MKPSHVKVWGLSLFVLVCVGAAFWGADRWRRDKRRNEVLQTVYAIQGAVVSAVSGENHDLSEIRVPRDGKWYILGDASYDSLIEKLHKSHGLCVSDISDVTGPLLDPWANRLRIMICDEPGQMWSIYTASNGSDGVADTGDEIGGTASYPYPGAEIYE